MTKLFFLLALGLSFINLPLFAQQSHESKFYCEQIDEADKWYSVGILLNDGPGYSVAVLENSDDDKTVKLIDLIRVSEKQVSKNIFLYSDKNSLVKITINTKTKEGVLNLLKDGPGSFTNFKLNCFKSQDIKF